MVYDSLVVTEVSVLLVEIWKEGIIDDKFDVKDFIAIILDNFMVLIMILKRNLYLQLLIILLTFKIYNMNKQDKIKKNMREFKDGKLYVRRIDYV